MKREFLRSSNPNVHHIAYGWAYTDAYLAEYANRMKLELELNTHFAKVVGAPSVRYGQLSEEQARNEELTGLIEMCVPTVVHEHLEKESGVQLDMVRPFSDKHDGMFAVYTNHDAEERFDVIEDSVGMESVANFMNEAMNHGEHKSRLLWWYDWDQLRVVRIVLSRASLCYSYPLSLGFDDACMILLLKTKPPHVALCRSLPPLRVRCHSHVLRLPIICCYPHLSPADSHRNICFAITFMHRLVHAGDTTVDGMDLFMHVRETDTEGGLKAKVGHARGHNS